VAYAADMALGSITAILWPQEMIEIPLVPMIAGPEGGPSSDMQRYEG
jgi:hypothetical protein